MALPSNIQRFIDEQAERAGVRYDDLRTCSKADNRSREVSNTDGLVAIVRGIFDRVGVELEEIRTVDRDIPPGLWPDMREHGYDSDEFPDIYKRYVAPAHILIIAGPIWLGDQSSAPRPHVRRRRRHPGVGEFDARLGFGTSTGGRCNRPVGRQRTNPLLICAMRAWVAVPRPWPGADAPGSGLTTPDAGVRQPLAEQRRLGLVRRDSYRLELFGHSSKATGPGAAHIDASATVAPPAPHDGDGSSAIRSDSRLRSRWSRRPAAVLEHGGPLATPRRCLLHRRC